MYETHLLTFHLSLPSKLMDLGLFCTLQFGDLRSKTWFGVAESQKLSGWKGPLEIVQPSC